MGPHRSCVKPPAVVTFILLQWEHDGSMSNQFQVKLCPLRQLVCVDLVAQNDFVFTSSKVNVV